MPHLQGLRQGPSPHRRPVDVQKMRTQNMRALLHQQESRRNSHLRKVSETMTLPEREPAGEHSMITTKPPCSAGGAHADQPWQCTRDGKDKARHLGRLCPAHYMQWSRAGYPDAFTFAPLRGWQPGSKGVALALYLPAEIVEGLRLLSASKGRSMSALCRPALARLLADDS